MSIASALVGLSKVPSVFWSFSRLGYQRAQARFDDADIGLQGKTVVITGANSGIGRAAAEMMIARGAQLWLVCRDAKRGREALEHISALALAGGSARLALADLSELAAVRKVAKTIAAGPVDALVHNAGALFSTRQQTRTGMDLDLALQLAGPFLLTQLLRERLAAHHGRVIFVSSGGMYSERLSLPALDWEGRSYDGVKAYAQVKRAQVALTQEWAERDREIDVHAMHPGWVDTPGVETSLPRFHKHLRRWLRTPVQGADTIVWLAGQMPQPGPSGSFWLDRKIAPRHILPNTVESADERSRLWDLLSKNL